MTCDRCTDIHKAQREGKTQRECGCSCHNCYSTGTNTFTLTGTTTGATDTAFAGNTMTLNTDSTGSNLVF